MLLAYRNSVSLPVTFPSSHNIVPLPYRPTTPILLLAILLTSNLPPFCLTEDEYCPRVFDGWSCFNYTRAGEVQSETCPYFVMGMTPKREYQRLRRSMGMVIAAHSCSNRLRIWKVILCCFFVSKVDSLVVRFFATDVCRRRSDRNAFSRNLMFPSCHR